MYKLRPLKKDPAKIESNGVTTPEGGGNEEGNRGNESTQPKAFNIDPRIFSIAHNAYANEVNNRMTVRQIDAMRKGLTLYDPKNNTKYLQGDFDALMAGE